MKEMNEKMGNHKFRLSDIMPHSWLYKLKGISSRKHLPSSPKHLSDASSSRKLRDTFRLSSPSHHPPASSPPKASFKRKIKRKTVYKPSSRLKLSSSPSSLINSHVSHSNSRNHHHHHRSKSSSANATIPSDSAVGSSSSNLVSSSPSDLESHPIDINNDHFVKKLDDIIEDSSISANSSPVQVQTVKETPFQIGTQQKLSSIGKKPKQTAGSSAGIRIRANSPKIARKKTTKGKKSPESKKKKGVPESFAIVLTSVDPERDFRESMVEMIVENKIKEQRDLEDLLACYLSLNSSEYHNIIIRSFEKTWFQLTSELTL